MSSMLLKVATVALTGVVLFAATDADARGGRNGGGRGGPVSLPDHRGGPVILGPTIRNQRDGRSQVQDHRTGRPLVRDHRSPIISPPVIGPTRPPSVRPPIISPPVIGPTRPPSVRPPVVNPPVVTQPPRGPGVIVDPVRPPRGHGHGHGYRRFAYLGGDLVPGCAVEYRRVYDQISGQFVRRRVVLCPEY